MKGTLVHNANSDWHGLTLNHQINIYELVIVTQVLDKQRSKCWG